MPAYHQHWVFPRGENARGERDAHRLTNFFHIDKNNENWPNKFVR
ncbi:Hypothetical protein SCC1_2490 [Pectobacterium versatile]|nr:Hypothetical protein SCC1_2490 [Pectobacterium versatile]PVY74617.1 hypothetical protein C7330_3926 [Pectobacterium versatile]